jgi:hypothetical protein
MEARGRVPCPRVPRRSPATLGPRLVTPGPGEMPPRARFGRSREGHRNPTGLDRPGVLTHPQGGASSTGLGRQVDQPF